MDVTVNRKTATLQGLFADLQTDERRFDVRNLVGVLNFSNASVAHYFTPARLLSSI